jgi:DNA repair protein RAD50
VSFNYNLCTVKGSENAFRYTKALDSIKSLRKDRLAELKAEKERLESLAREKQHADKLRARIADLTSTIATKEVEYEQTKKEYEDLVKSNAQFYDYSTKFREMYLKIGNLEERKARYEAELEEAKETTQEVEGELGVLSCQYFMWD